MKLKTNIYNICLYIPFILYTLIMAILFFSLGRGSIIMWITLLWFALLFLTSFGLSSNKKRFKLLGLISLLLFFISTIFIGYFDYNQWGSTIFGGFVVIYYFSIYMAKNNKLL